jgi:hypothetical protein
MPADSTVRAISAIDLIKRYEAEKLRAEAATSPDVHAQHLKDAEHWLNLALEMLRYPT